MTPKGISLHIGLNAVDPAHYKGWNGELNACENDAAVYQAIAKKSGFENIHVLLTKEANTRNLFRILNEAADELKEGDMLFLSYSGHGGSIPDFNEDERDDGMDETWCLYDRQVLDDELHEYFAKFKPGVRILMISDSCHSGTVARVSPTNTEVGPEDKEHYVKSRLAPLGVMIRTYNANKEMYDAIGRRPAVDEEEIDAFVILFAACQDDEEALEVWDHGMFTAKVKKVLEGTVETYKQFFNLIKKGFPKHQVPNLYRYGNQRFDFVKQAPFSLNGKAPTGLVVPKTKKPST